MWSEKILHMLSVFLNFLRLVLWHMIYPGECAVYILEERVLCRCWNVLCMSVRFIWSKAWFKSNVSRLIFYLGDLDPLLKLGYWSSYCHIIFCYFLQKCLICLGALMLGAYIFITVILFMNWAFHHGHLCFITIFDLKSVLSSEWNFSICTNMDGLGGHHARRDK